MLVKWVHYKAMSTEEGWGQERPDTWERREGYYMSDSCTSICVCQQKRKRSDSHYRDDGKVRGGPRNGHKSKRSIEPDNQGEDSYTLE